MGAELLRLQIKKDGACIRIRLASVLFLAVFFPYIKISGYVFPTLVLSHIAVALFFLLRLRLGFFELIFIGYSVASFILVSIVSLLKMHYPDLRLIFLFLYLPILVVAARAVAELEIKSAHGFMVDILPKLFAFHSLVIVLLNLRVFSPDFLYGIIYVDPKVFTYPIERYPGFSYDAFSYVSVLQAFGFCILLSSFSRRASVVGFFWVLISFLSVVMSGRAGIIVVAAFIAQRILFFDFRVIAYGLAFFLLLVGAFTFDWGPFDWYKNWAFSFIVGLLSGEGISDSSALEIRHHIFFPNNWVVGDAVDFLGVKSDLGFIRIVNSYGLFGLVIFFSFYALLALFCLRAGGGLPLFFVVCLCLLNFKDVYLVAPYGHFFLIFYLCFVGRYRGANYAR